MTRSKGKSGSKSVQDLRSGVSRQAVSNRKSSGLIGIGFALVVLIVVMVVILPGLTDKQGEAVAIQSLPAEISVQEAYGKYQQGAFILDVRTQDEWDEFHAPDTTLIPLDQLESRLNEVPQDKEIVVVCRSGNRSRSGRNILLNAGFERVTSMSGGLSQWRAAGYPIEPGP